MIFFYNIIFGLFHKIAFYNFNLRRQWTLNLRLMFTNVRPWFIYNIWWTKRTAFKYGLGHNTIVIKILVFQSGILLLLKMSIVGHLNENEFCKAIFLRNCIWYKQYTISLHEHQTVDGWITDGIFFALLSTCVIFMSHFQLKTTLHKNFCEFNPNKGRFQWLRLQDF